MEVNKSQKTTYQGDIAKVKQWILTLQAKQEQLTEQIVSFKDEADKLGERISETICFTRMYSQGIEHDAA